MRHGSNTRRPRRGGGNGNGGGNNRRPNPRTQTFDSNGPDVRIRGTAFQITEKYLTLAKDAGAAGDNVLAESYFQHAEHYQRIINTITEQIQKTEAQQPQPQPAQQAQPQPVQQAQPQPVQQAQPVERKVVRKRTKPVEAQKSDKMPKGEETEGLLAVLKADEMPVAEKTVADKPKRAPRRRKNPETEKVADPV